MHISILFRLELILSSSGCVVVRELKWVDNILLNNSLVIYPKPYFCGIEIRYIYLASFLQKIKASIACISLYSH